VKHGPTCACKNCVALRALKKSRILRDAAAREADREAKREEIEAYERDFWLTYGMGKD
jgi:hypothetical protein